MANRLGYECKLYVGDTALVAGEDATDGTYTEVDAAKDVSLPLDKAEADITTRANDGWKSTRGGLKDASVEFDLLWDAEDAQIETIRDAYLNNTLTLLAIMDGNIATSGSEGFVANFEIMTFSHAQPLEEGVTVSVTAKPRSFHEWYEVA